MAVEWTLLDQFSETSFDTPELVKEREAVNAEITAILEKRQSIDAALSVVKNTPVDQLTVKQITDARKAKEAQFELLKKELKTRKTLIPAYYDSVRAAAKAAGVEQKREVEKIEAEVREGVENLGYTPFSHNNPGGYREVMIRSNSRVAEAHRIFNLLEHHSGHYDNTRENNNTIQVLERELNTVMRQLVGVSNGIEMSTAPIHITADGVG